MFSNFQVSICTKFKYKRKILIFRWIFIYIHAEIFPCPWTSPNVRSQVWAQSGERIIKTLSSRFLIYMKGPGVIGREPLPGQSQVKIFLNEFYTETLLFLGSGPNLACYLYGLRCCLAFYLYSCKNCSMTRTAFNMESHVWA